MTEQQEFGEFYGKWPRKVAKSDAWKAWQQTRAVRPPLTTVLAAVAAYCAWRTRLASRGEFVPPPLYPATWLRGERWADEFDVAPAAPAVAPVVVDPAEAHRRQAERMATMRARTAWADVMKACDARSMPLGGWVDARTAATLESAGGFDALGRCVTRAQISEMANRFERAYVDADLPIDSSTTGLRLVRRA